MAQNVSLSTEARTLLFDTACEMLEKGVERMRVRGSEVEMLVRTRFEEKLLVAVGGVEFFAEIETEFGRGNVKYLVRPLDAGLRDEQLAWVPVRSMVDLTEKPGGGPLLN